MQLSIAFGRYWESRKRDFSWHTVEDYERTFARLLAFLPGDVELEAVTSADIDRFLNDAAETYHWSSKSTLNAWIALSSLWSWAELQFGVVHIIRGKVRRPKARRRIIEPFQADDVRGMLRVCERSRRYRRPGQRAASDHANVVETALRNRALVLTLCDTGLRASELCDLTLADYDAGRARLVVRHGKGDKERLLFLGVRASKALQAYLATREDPGPAERLFVNRFGQPLTRSGLLQLIESLGRRAGVADSHPHRFRHTFAIAFLKNGGNTIALQDLLGHEDMATVRLYARLADDDREVQAKTNSPSDRWAL